MINNKLTPFKWCMLQTFPFIEATFDAIDNYGLLCKIVEYVNKNIIKTNELGIKVEELNNWFNNLNVQDEINNKLDEMAENGTLEEIINQEIFNELNEKINTNTSDINTLKNKIINTPELLFGVSFKAQGLGVPSETDFIISLDGINFSNIKIPDFYLRDPSITFDSIRKKFYMTGTPETQSDYTFIIYSSEDLINWETHRISIPSYLENIKWSPDLYYDKINDRLIVSFSYKYGTETDIEGNNIDAFDIIIAETTDFNNFVMNNVHTANLINKQHRSHIDSNIIFYNNFWYLLVNEQYSKTLEVYFSSNLEDFTLLCQNVLNINDKLDNTIYLEGGCQYIFNNKYNLVADSYAHLHNIIQGTSDDLLNFKFSLTNLYNFRHCDVINITDDVAKNIISSLPNFNISTSNNINKTEEIIPAIFIQRNTSREFTAIPNSIIMIAGSSTITNLRNPFNCEEQKFLFLANAGENLTIQKIDDITKNKNFINTNYNNEKVFSISLNKNGNFFGSDTFEELNLIDFNTLSTYITDKNENIEITDGIAYKSGNVIHLFLDVKILNQIDLYLTPLFRLEQLAPVTKVQLNNSLNKNISMFNNGYCDGQVSGNANSQFSITATYISFK